MKIRVVLASIVLGLLAQVQVSAQVVDCVCDSEYSVGDRVVLTGESGLGDLPVGSLGTVVCGSNAFGGNLILVDWDGYDLGHDGNGYCTCGESAGSGTSNFYVDCGVIQMFTLIECACDSEYSVGDRVTLLVDDPDDANGLPAGTAGTVLCGTSAFGDLYVSWDGWSKGHNNNFNCECQDGVDDSDNSHWIVECDQIRAGAPRTLYSEGIYGLVSIAQPFDTLILQSGQYAVNGDGSAVVVDVSDITLRVEDWRGYGTGDIAILDATGSSDRVLLVTSNASFENLVFRGGVDPGNGGAGARIEGSATFTNCQFIYNSGTGAHIYEGDPTFNGCDFKYNNATAISNGGGIASEYGDFTMNECEVSHNAATNGGGIYANLCYHSLNTVVIKGNSALEDGAGIYQVGGAGSYNNVSIRKNGANRHAGGVLLEVGASPSFTDCIVSQNTARFGGGFACYTFNMPTFTGGEISDNVASGQGGGVFCSLSTFTIEDSSVCGNAPDHIWGAWYDLGGNDFSDTCGEDGDSGFCRADTNEDYNVDVLDLLYVIAVWGTDNRAGDINGDGWVDVMDLLDVIGGWGGCNE